jgi:hypothetical protein
MAYECAGGDEKNLSDANSLHIRKGFIFHIIPAIHVSQNSTSAWIQRYASPRSTVPSKTVTAEP